MLAKGEAVAEARGTHGDLHGERGRRPGEHRGRAANPLAKVQDIAWLEFRKPDLVRAEAFAHDFGFTTTLRTAEELHLRGVGRGAPCVIIRKGDRSTFLGPAFRAADGADVLRLGELTGATVHPLPDPLGGIGVELVDPSGLSVKVVADLDVLPPLPHQSPQAWNVGDQLTRVKRHPAGAARTGPGPAAGTRGAADHQVRGDARLVPRHARADRQRLPVLPGPTAAGADDERAAVLELIRPWTRELPEDAFQLVRAGDYTFRAQVADRWRDRRAFLLGDAAHLTPPFIGQGLGAELRDAANLSWKLAGVLAGGFDDTCLDTYELERKAHSTAMIRLAVRLGTAMTAGGRRTELLRRAILPRLSLFPGLRARAVDSATPRLVRSAFARRSVRHPFLGGALCPNADPVRAFSRKAGRASEIAGHPIRTGDRVLVLYASANRDERVWADPDAFDVTRKCCHQLGFGQARTGARVRAWDAWRRRPCWWSCWLPSNASS